MSGEISDLSHMDYRILKFLSNDGTATVEQIAKRLPKGDDVEYRLSVLAKREYSDMSHTYIQNSSYIFEKMVEKKGTYGTEYLKTGRYCITPKGIKALQDYLDKRKRDNRLLWMKNAWIPILVSIVINLLIALLQPVWSRLSAWLQCVFS